MTSHSHSRESIEVFSNIFAKHETWKFRSQFYFARRRSRFTFRSKLFHGSRLWSETHNRIRTVNVKDRRSGIKITKLKQSSTMTPKPNNSFATIQLSAAAPPKLSVSERIRYSQWLFMKENFARKLKDVGDWFIRWRLTWLLWLMRRPTKTSFGGFQGCGVSLINVNLKSTAKVFFCAQLPAINNKQRIVNSQLIATSNIISKYFFHDRRRS